MGTRYGGYGCHAMGIFELTGFGPHGDTMWRGQIMQTAARVERLDRCTDELPCMDAESRGAYWACVEACCRANADAVYRMVPLITDRMRRCNS